MDLIDKFNQSKSEQNWFQNNYPSKPVSFFAADLKKTLSSPVDYDTDIVKILDVEYIRLKNIEESYVEYMKEKKMIGDISLSKDLSEIIINTPSIFEQSDSPYAIKTKWAVSNEIGCVDTSFTYAIHRGYSEYLECEDEEKSKQIKEAIDSIVWEAINLLNPSTVAISLNTIYEYLYKSNRLVLDNEKVNSIKADILKYYDALLNKEKLNNEAMKINFIKEQSVLEIMIYTVYHDIMDLLEQAPNLVKKFEEQYPLYKDSYQTIFTNHFIKVVLLSGIRYTQEDNLVQKTSRFLRNEILKWVKTPKKEDRPEYIPVFKLLNQKILVVKYYQYLLYNIGNLDKVLNSQDENIEHAAKALEETKADKNSSKDAINVAQATYDNLVKAKENTLKTKSLVAFYIQECTLNEKIAKWTFSIESVIAILSCTPIYESAAHDSYSEVASLFTKRDFQPMGYESVNPCYMHFNEGDVSSPEVKLLASIISGMVNPSMPSLQSTATARTFMDLYVGINILKTNFSKVKEHYVNLIKTNIFSLGNAICANIDRTSKKNENFDEEIGKLLDESDAFDIVKDELTEDDLETITKITETVERICSAQSLSDLLDFEVDFMKTKDKRDEESMLSWIKSSGQMLRNVLEEWKDARDRYFNIVKLYDDILTNYLSGRGNKKSDNEPFKDLWPLTTQYEWPAKESEKTMTSEEAQSTYMLNLKPGDIGAGRYGSRATHSEICD